ncbi:hypothetical protein E1293_36085 [Actinomadura darangshiensis]|uniref:Uncharacterized protein n=1 Tax=Actinomadura darangshiensis TaxID=705336 RepID=A0A4R5AGR5_9ACTN|nr:hypothetical protein E1293_36085 [Actinomadura darangshiensis]
MFAIAAVTALLLRATQPSAALTADPGHPLTSSWLVPVLLGIGLATPLPVLRWRALARLVTVAVRTLAAPAAALSAMVLAANSGVVEQPTGFVKAALIGCYWAVLAFTALRLCSLVARVAAAAAMPTTGRLRAALLLIGTGLALAAGQSLFAIVGTAPGGGSVTVMLVLGLLAAATIRAGHDLRPDRTA